MKKIIIIELKRAFLNKTFLVAVLLGTMLAVLQVVFEALPYAFITSLFPDQYPPSVFNSCMGLTLGIWQYVFYMVFPILASLPYSNSYLQDSRTGIIKSIYIRTNRQQYLTAKLLAVFLSGGFTAVIPIIINYFLVSLCVPAVIPHAATGFFPIFAQSTWAEIFYTNPWLYVLLFAILLFLTAGILACSALAFSFFIKYSYVVILTPFLLFLAISYASSLVSFRFPTNISHWIVPSQSFAPLNLLVVTGELAIILLVSIVVYYYKGLNNETI